MDIPLSITKRIVSKSNRFTVTKRRTQNIRNDTWVLFFCDLNSAIVAICLQQHSLFPASSAHEAKASWCACFGEFGLNDEASRFRIFTDA